MLLLTGRQYRRYMTHSHGHNIEDNQTRAFILGIGLNIAFVVVEISVGLIISSSALLADAGHNTSDVLSLVFAMTAAWMARLRPRGKYTYGLRKTTILVSILNAFLLFGAVVAIGWGAIEKLSNPHPVPGTSIMIVAGVGVVINAVTAMLFLRGRKSDLNIRGAFLHMAADAAVSAGVVLAGLMINLTGKTWIDPVMSFVIIAVILIGTWRLFTDSINLALDAVPKQIDLDVVSDFLLSRKDVEGIHDLHIWAMSTTQVALTVHLVMPSGYDDTFLGRLQEELKINFGIGHTTFQIENKKMEEDCMTGC